MGSLTQFISRANHGVAIVVYNEQQTTVCGLRHDYSRVLLKQPLFKDKMGTA